MRKSAVLRLIICPPLIHPPHLEDGKLRNLGSNQMRIKTWLKKQKNIENSQEYQNVMYKNSYLIGSQKVFIFYTKTMIKSYCVGLKHVNIFSVVFKILRQFQKIQLLDRKRSAIGRSKLSACSFVSKIVWTGRGYSDYRHNSLSFHSKPCP